MAYGTWRGVLNAQTEHPDALRFQPPASCGTSPLLDDIATARRLLAGRHLLFIGDSVLRYQVRHLIYALHFGRWLPRFRGSPTAPSPTHIPDYGSWGAYQANATADLGPDSFRCDCHRNFTHHQNHYETSYYYNREWNINVTYTWHGKGFKGAHYPMGHFHVPVTSPDEMYADRTSTLAWSGYNTSEVVDMILKGLGPVDEVIVAVGGLWIHHPPFMPVSENYLAPLQRLLKDPHATPIYATVTHDSDWYHDGKINGSFIDGVGVAKALRWRMLDRGGAVRQLRAALSGILHTQPDLNPQELVEMVQADQWHFTGLVYQAFNSLLLTVLAETRSARPLAEHRLSHGPGADSDSESDVASSSHSASPWNAAGASVDLDTILAAVTVAENTSLAAVVRTSSGAQAVVSEFIFPTAKRDCWHSASNLVMGEWIGRMPVLRGSGSSGSGSGSDSDSDSGSDVDGSSRLRYVPPQSCAGLADHPLDLATAQRRLAGKHILIIGDSQLALQARSLIYGLHFGRWPPPFFTGNHSHHSPLCHKGHTSFVSYFDEFTDTIGRRALRCDCFRDDGVGVRFENMFYVNHELDIKVTFLLEAAGLRGAHRPLGHVYSWDDSRLRFPDLHDPDTLAFAGRHMSVLVDSVLSDVGPVDDVVVAVSAPWPAEDLAVVERVLKDPHRSPIYASAVVDPGNYQDGLVNDRVVDGIDVALRRGWRVLDRGGMARSLYRWAQEFAYFHLHTDDDDGTLDYAGLYESVFGGCSGDHAAGFVYENMNTVLLAMVLT